MNDRDKLYQAIEILRSELNKMADMDLTEEAVLNKSRELDKLLNEYQKKYMQ